MIDFLIDDSTPSHFIFPPGVTTGLDLSNRPEGFAYSGTAEPFPDELVIPRPEWQARIQELEETKTRLSDLCTLAGLPCKDQERTNYCWVNAPTYCVEVTRVKQNQKQVILSAASAGAQITNYRNIGGWGKDALNWISTKGLVPESLWPKNAISKSYATSANLQTALDYRVDEWWELEPKNLDHVVSCLLRRIPVAVGYNWWGHEVTLVDPVWLDGTVAIRMRNSWGMGWGDKGYSLLQGNRMLPDDAVVPRTVKAA